jgi:signal transduction histidine kinase
MKKKIVLGLLFIIIFFTAGGFYLTNTFNQIIGTLQNIITLQQMDFEKKIFLNKIEVIQTDLLLKNSPHTVETNILLQHVQDMEKELHACTGCHHTSAMTERINALHVDVKQYLGGLSRVYTLKADRQRQLQELNNTYAQGSDLTDQIAHIIAASSQTATEEASIAKISIYNTKNILIFLVTTGPLLLIITAFFFMKGFSRSLSVLTEATRRIQLGEEQFLITEELKDEFGELASSFNNMTSSLHEQYNKLQEAERLAVVGELAAGMAHEIKNPLAGIKVSVEVLSQDLDLDQEDKEIFLQVVNEIDRINALLKSLLSYARPPKPESVSFDVYQVLETTIKSAQYSLKGTPEGTRKKIEFIRDYDSKVPKIIADPGQLQQVLLNLFLNAGDAISRQGTITVQTRKISAAAIRIAVSDDGKGIDSQSLEKVFKPFFSTKSQGTGLGLAICKRLVEQHSGGNIAVANNPDGAGTTFTITLPIHPLETEVVAQ